MAFNQNSLYLQNNIELTENVKDTERSAISQLLVSKVPQVDQEKKVEQVNDILDYEVNNQRLLDCLVTIEDLDRREKTKEATKNYLNKLYFSNIFIEVMRKKLYRKSERQKKTLEDIDKEIKEYPKDKLIQYYYKTLNENTQTSYELDEEEIKFWNIIFFHFITFVKIMFYPLTFIYYRFTFGDKFSTIFKLIMKHSIPLIYYQSVWNLRDSSNNDENIKIFSNDVYIKQDDELNSITKFTFNLNSISPYLVSFLIINLYVLAGVFNFIGITEIKDNSSGDYMQMFGINFIILFYLFLNICTNIYISIKGNNTKSRSNKKELLDLMSNEDIQSKQLYLNFIKEPINKDLLTCIQCYEDAFYKKEEEKKKEGEPEPEISQQSSNIQEMEDDIQQDFIAGDIQYKKDWVSGVGLLTQHLFQPERDAASLLPFQSKSFYQFNKDSKNSKNPQIIRRLILFTYNNLLFPSILIGLLTKITYNSYNSMEKNKKINVDIGKASILVSLWICLVLYLFIQLNNRYVKKTFQSRLYALQRLGLMISLGNKIQYVKAKKDLPTIDIFCVKSLSTWYDLRVMSMKYKLNSLLGWVTLLLIEFFLITVESLSQFFDSNGDLQYQLPKMNPYLRYMLIIGLIQRITTFIIPCLFQQAKINEQYQLHRKILSQHLYKLKQIQTTIEFDRGVDAQFHEFQDLGKAVNVFGVTMEVFCYEANKSIRRQAYSNIQKDKENINTYIYPEKIDNQKFKEIQMQYIKELIFKYEEILVVMEKDINKHQIFILGMQPISFQLISLVLISFITYGVTTVVDMTTNDFVSTCSS